MLTGDREFVLVEATKTMSLQSDLVRDSFDKNWLGTCTFARSNGILHLALNEWRTARTFRDIPVDSSYYYTEGSSAHYCIISDARSDPTASKIAMIQRAPSPHFFFSVPLRDADGIVIGSLSMVDDKPRYGVSAEEMLFSEDLADTIAQHLQGAVMSVQKQRSEHLIQALGTFNSGGSSLRDWWMGQNHNSMARGALHAGPRPEYLNNATFALKFGEERNRPTTPQDGSTTDGDTFSSTPRLEQAKTSASIANEEAATQRDDHGMPGEDFDLPVKTPQSPPDEAGSRAIHPKPERQEHPQTSENKYAQSHSNDPLKQAHSRASNLFREAMGAQGVAFFDAHAVSTAHSITYANVAEAKGHAMGMESGKSSSTSVTTNDTDTSDTGRRSKRARVVACSIQGTDELPQVPLHIAERDLAKLIKTYP